MNLQRYQWGDRTVEVISRNPDLERTAAALRSTDWNAISFVVLWIDDENYLEGCGSHTNGFGVNLSVEGIVYPPESLASNPVEMLPQFHLYLAQDFDRLFEIIFDAEQRGLNRDDVESLRQAAVKSQLESSLVGRLDWAAGLLAQKKYADYVAVLEPVQSLLSDVHLKKLELARKRAARL